MTIRMEVLREVRKMRFLEVHDRYVGGCLSLVEAAETLGMSERHFRRLRGRFALEGEAGLLDRRLGKVSPHRIAADGFPAPLFIVVQRDDGDACVNDQLEEWKHVPRVHAGKPVQALDK